jgi:ATP-dependent protease HslVU (ClpYQ) ATPase subunit
MEPKDFSRFQGLSREEVAQKLAAEKKEKLDAALAPLRAQSAREKRAREAEAEQRRRQVEEQRMGEARAQLEAEKQRRLRIWMMDGGDPDLFEKQWPQMLSRIMERKQEERQQRIDEGSIL